MKQEKHIKLTIPGDVIRQKKKGAIDNAVQSLLSLIPEQGEVIAEYYTNLNKGGLILLKGWLDIIFSNEHGEDVKIIIKQKHNDKGDWGWKR